MKQFVKSIIPFAAAAMLSSCGNNNESKTETTANQDHTAMEQHQTATKPVLKNDHLNAVYQHYIHLTTALTNSDMADARVAANAIEAGAKDIQGAATVVTEAGKIIAAADIEKQRQAYSALSKEMEQLIKKEGLAGGELYVEYCPMAFDNKGATWISNSKDIRNPYFGEKMMNCGEVQETIQ